jgi:hypothetical protein
MNTGIGDVINLAWKLAAVLGQLAQDNLLDIYEAERIGFARRLVATTDRVFSFVTAEGRLADIVRTRVAPLLIPRAMAFEAVREALFRTVSQITLNYRDSSLSQGVAGRVHGGDRLPWAPIDELDNFESLTAMTWQVHVYGAAGAGVAAWCSERQVPLRIFDWREDYVKVGISRNSLYLLRPDTYIGFAAANGTSSELDRYCTEHAVQLGVLAA